MKWNKIGFGTWPLSGDKNGSVSYGKVDEKESEKALITAFENGINVYDTSNFYGFGYVESLLGNVFSGLRDDIVLITKGGFVDRDTQNFDPIYLKTALMESLSRLKTDYVDVYMLHSPSYDILDDINVIRFLLKLKHEGISNKTGVSVRSPEDGMKALSINKYFFKVFDVIEINYNILDHRAENNGFFNLCKQQNIKTVVRTPLGQGLLSGKFKFNGDVADIRQHLWNGEKVKRKTEIYKKMLESLNPNDYTDAQNCLRFCLSNPNVSVIIPGMKTEDEVKENVKTNNLPLLTKEELDRISIIYKENDL
jgi:myo-inositol catabolism protein IolS